MLEDLHASIWRDTGRKIVHQRGRREFETPVFEETRSITESEWRALWRYVDENHVPVGVVCWDFGFRFAIVFYRASEFPGIEENTAALTLTWKHIEPLVPGLTEDLSYDRRFDRYWEFVRPLVRTDRNQEKLKVCGLPKVESGNHYRY